MSTRDKERIELLQGTLDLLILRTLLPGPAHGHAIAKTIEFHSADVLQVEQGSLYPAFTPSYPPRLDFFRRGYIREQSPRQVLSPDRQRTPSINS
jgi:hypothetical protein